MNGGEVHFDAGQGSGSSSDYGSAAIRCQGTNANVKVNGGTMYLSAKEVSGAFHAGIQNKNNSSTCPINVGNCYV